MEERTFLFTDEDGTARTAICSKDGNKVRLRLYRRVGPDQISPLKEEIDLTVSDIEAYHMTNIMDEVLEI